MKLTPGHVIAYLLGISGNVWAAFVSDLPDKVRGWVEATLLGIPLIVIGSWAYPTCRGWAIARAEDFQRTLAWLLMMVMALLWVIDMRRRGIPPEEINLYVLAMFLILAVFSYKPKVARAA